MNRLSPDNAVEYDPKGKILPSRKAFLEIERRYPGAPPAEKWRLAQAQTLIDAVKADSQSSSTDS
ncbi:MAG: hypothetical protein ACXU9B_05995 [Reyranella sp.]